MKWREKPFPWFQDILLITGETIATGKYRFHGGLVGEEDEGDEGDIFDDDELTRPTSSSAQTPATSPATPIASPVATTDIEEESEEESESGAKKRHSDSQKLLKTMARKKKKVSGVDMMETMNKGIMAMAEALLTQPEAIIPKDTVDSTIVGQAQERVQDEGYLTMEGQLLLLELLTDSTKARTYMSIKKGRAEEEVVRRSDREEWRENERVFD